MAIDAGTIRVRATGDTRDATSGIDDVSAGLERLQREAKETGPRLRVVSDELDHLGNAKAPAAAKGIEDVSTRSKAARGAISAAGQAISAMGGAAGTAGGKVSSLASALMGGFALGGAVGLGIGAAVTGFQMLATEIRESAAEARQLSALNDVLGVTRSEVERVEAAFRAAGSQLDRSVVQTLIATSREAGISTVELAAMADEIKRIQDLTGIDVGGAAAKIAAQRQKDATKDYVSDLKAIADARDQEMSGIPAWEAQLRAGYEADAKAIDDLTAKITRLRQEEARTSFGSDESKALRAQMEAAVEERARLRERQAEAEETFRRHEQHASFDADEKEAISYVTKINRQRAAAEAESRRRAAERKQEADEAQRTQELIASSEASSIHRVRLLQAQAAGDRRAEIIAQADFEVQQAAEVMWKHPELADQMRAEITAIREKQRADIAAIAEKEIADEKAKSDRIAQEARAAADRALADRKRDHQLGVQAGFSFVGGLKDGIERGDLSSIVRSLLGFAGSMLSIFDGGLSGTIISGIGSLFHEGGMVGTGGRSLPKYHGGGMIKAHRGMMLPQPGPGEVPIMAQLGEGVLSRQGVAAAGGPQAVAAYNRGEAPQVMRGGDTAIYVSAFDPASSVEALAKVYEPAAVARGLAYSDARTVALARRQARAPRSGR